MIFSVNFVICEYFTKQTFKTTECTWIYSPNANLLWKKKNHRTVPLIRVQEAFPGPTYLLWTNSYYSGHFWLRCSLLGGKLILHSSQANFCIQQNKEIDLNFNWIFPPFQVLLDHTKGGLNTSILPSSTRLKLLIHNNTKSNFYFIFLYTVWV